MTRARQAIVLALGVSMSTASGAAAQKLDAIVYTVRVADPETHYLEVEASIPTSRRASIEMMMPIWSPGYYRVEDYAGHVSDFTARTRDGVALSFEKSRSNRWRIQTNGQPIIVLSYRVFCNQRSVTTNYVGADMGVINGAPTFITLVEKVRRPHEVHMELPAAWKRAMTGMDDAPDGMVGHFRAADFETLVDSPIVAGDLNVHEFVVAGKKHYVVGAGDTGAWDAEAATRELAQYVEECYRFWGFLPYEKYDFLLMFRPGGGGLEHKTSNLSTITTGRGGGPGGRGTAAGSATSASAQPSRLAASHGWPALGLVSHEYFHLFNVKRLRPIELGPFDFENKPTTGSLWISEGVTSYYSTLLVERAGLSTPDEYLSSLGRTVGELQKSPGRLLQSVDESSRDVWNNSNSGVNPAATTVSYYVKGQVLGLLLDARVRHLTAGRRSFDDVIRLAYKRYSGERGFTPEQFRKTTEEIAGTDLSEWFRKSVSTAEELDYSEALDWFGLRLMQPDDPSGPWSIAVRPDATPEQQVHLREWLHPTEDRARAGRR